MRPTAAQMAASLGLEPHPEGGYYLETYRAAQTLLTPRGERPASTAILFLVTAGSVSRLHRLTGDELWVYQGGLPLELTMISPRGGLEVRVLGEPWESVRGRATADAPADAHPVGRKDLALVPPREDRRAWLPQALVPAGSWQGARLAGGPHLPADRAWALVSCVVTPGFDFADFELGDREALLAAFPQHADLVRALT